MAIAVSGDEQDSLVSVHLLSKGSIRGRHRVGPQINGVFQVLLGALAAFNKVLKGRFRRSKAVGRLQRFGSLRFVTAVRNDGQHQLVNRSYIVIPRTSGPPS